MKLLIHYPAVIIQPKIIEQVSIYWVVKKVLVFFILQLNQTSYVSTRVSQ